MDESDPALMNAYQSKSWLARLNWRRKLAVIVWALCVLGSFLPTSSPVILDAGRASIYGFSQASTAQRLVWISLPLAMMWVGSWLSDEDNLDDSAGSAVKKVLGILVEFIAWVRLAQLIGFYLLGPLILMVS